MRNIALTALAALVTATPALAQDGAPFTGPRIEGIIGWDQLRSAGKDDGMIYGGGVGYDMQMGKLMLGIDGEITTGRDQSCAGTATLVDPRLCTRGERDLYAGARLGGVVGNNFLLYGKAGYTNLRARFTSDNGTTFVTSKDDLDGWRVGGGAEYAFTPHMSVKAEYRYSNYNRDVERHQVVGGLAVRF